ncbi:DUF4404 family protein [Agitococcus lubricus]|uniref:Uncharacterized protein DUF4404 n=1 Tax=Agitococcus lubricus TaxID=1077255 RepID=A0A2T5IWV6_9GAMM|nr:DUF4404 family protein [Agitococcus lubricus]PTQ88408.1 uncharacterized protein DUF4404 [Agitococcus lubricus]
MPKQLLGEKIAEARSILALHPLPPPHIENLQAQLCDLELHLQSHEQADYERLANLLRAAEAELEVDHPIVARVIGSIVKTLMDIGI